VEAWLRKHLPGGRFQNVSAQRSSAMRAVGGRGNKTTEVRFRLALARAGIRGWTVRPKGMVGSPDILFTARSLAVFLDGCFWHGCPKCGHLPKTNIAFWRAKIEGNRGRDRRNTSLLRRQGLVVLRFWEHQLIPDSMDRCVNRLKCQLQRKDAGPKKGRETQRGRV